MKILVSGRCAAVRWGQSLIPEKSKHIWAIKKKTRILAVILP